MGLFIDATAGVNLKPVCIGLYIDVVAGASLKPLFMGLYVEVVAGANVYGTVCCCSCSSKP